MTWHRSEVVLGACQTATSVVAANDLWNLVMNRSDASPITFSGIKTSVPKVMSASFFVSNPRKCVTPGSALDPTPRLLINFACAIACGCIAVISWNDGIWPFSLICWLIGGHFLHTFALSFHDAAHGTLHPRREINEVLGHFYGTLILVPLTVYRRAHARHHAHLASIDDPELFPFVDPGSDRMYRIVCVCAELVLGYFYTPLLFARSVFTDQRLTNSVRQRIFREYALIGGIMLPSLIAIGLMDQWHNYFIGVVAPVLAAGSYQTLRKYTEHLGLNGSTILQSTRSILPRDQWNKTISSLMQHVDHHGTHHMHARIPFTQLPPASEELYRERAEDLPVYPHYAAAVWAMILTLPDPKAGSQWLSER